MSRFSTFAFVVISVGVYLVLALLFTWPLIGSFTTHTPAIDKYISDDQFFLWQYWWTKTALIDHANELWKTTMLFFPTGVDLRAGVDGIFPTLLSIPFQLLTNNLILSYNLVLLLMFIGAAITTNLLVLDLTRSRFAALCGGIIFGFSSFLLQRGLQHMNILSALWIPFFVLCFLRAFRTAKIRWAIAAGVGLALAALGSWYYLLASLIFVGLGVLWELAQQRPVMRATSICLGVAFILILPFAIPSISSFIEDPPLPVQPGLRLVASLDVLGFLTPPSWLLVGGSVTQPIDGMLFLWHERIAYLGVVELALVIWWFGRRQSLRQTSPSSTHAEKFWMFVSVVFALLALGPNLTMAGTSIDVPMPSDLLLKFPPFSSLSSPSRFVIYTFLGLAVLSGFAIRHMTSFFRGRKKLILVGFLLGLLVIERVPRAYPIVDRTPLPYTSILRDDPSPGAVLNIPVITDVLGGVAIYDQVSHGRPIVDGYTQRNVQKPETKRFIYQNDILRYLSCEEYPTDQPARSPPIDRRLFGEFLTENGIEFVVLHRALRGCRPEVRLVVEELLNEVAPFYEDEGVALYRSRDFILAPYMVRPPVTRWFGVPG